MEYTYATCLLNEADEEINEENLTAVLEAANVSVEESRVKALVAALEGVDLDEVTSVDPETASAPDQAPPAAAERPTDDAPAAQGDPTLDDPSEADIETDQDSHDGQPDAAQPAGDPTRSESSDEA